MPSVDGIISGTQLKQSKLFHGDGGVKVGAAVGEINRLEFERVCAKPGGETETFTVVFSTDSEENLVISTKTGAGENARFDCLGQDLPKVLAFVTESLKTIYPEAYSFEGVILGN
jgi:hypothetical protein